LFATGEPLLAITSPQNALSSSTHIPKERGYEQQRTHSKTLADLWGLISPQHFDDMPTPKEQSVCRCRNDSKSEMCSLLAKSHPGTLERHLFAFVEDGLAV